MLEKTPELEEVYATGLMDQLPKTVRVGLYDFRLCLVGSAKAASEKRWGAFSCVEQTVELQRIMPSRYKAVDTFFHEVTHAIFWAYSIDDKEDGEERMVSILGSGLATLHRDNPWITKWVESANL